jgi:hypothetical protein
MSVTIADNRIDQMHEALHGAFCVLDRWKSLERELNEVRGALSAAAEAIYDGTLYDPEGERVDAS